MLESWEWGGGWLWSSAVLFKRIEHIVLPSQADLEQPLMHSFHYRKTSF